MCRAQASCHPEQSRRTCSLCRPDQAKAPCRPDRAKRAEESAAFRLIFHRKRNGKPLMLIKTHSLPFPFLFLCPTLARRTRTFLTPQAYFLVTSGISREVCWQRQIPRLRSSGPTLGMTEKAKTVGKRNSFPGFSFFECFSIALFLFLSCGDAYVSPVQLFWFIFLFIFAYE